MAQIASQYFDNQHKGISEDMKNNVQGIMKNPKNSLINLAIKRAPYIFQSQSLNMYITETTLVKISLMRFYS